MALTPLADTAALSVGTTSSRAAIPLPGGLTAWKHDVSVVNAGSAMVFVALGGSTVTASAPVVGTPSASFPVAAGQTVTLGANGAGYLAAIAASGTNTIYVTAGAGSA